MSNRIFPAIAAIAAVGALALAALPSCSSDIAGCNQILVNTIPQDSLNMFVGDSTRVYAAVVNTCPEKISYPVVFSATDASVAAVRQVDDTTAVVRGVAPGLGGFRATARDRVTVYTTVPVRVTAH